MGAKVVSFQVVIQRPEDSIAGCESTAAGATYVPGRLGPGAKLGLLV